MLDIKKTLTKLLQMFTVTKTTITPTRGTAYATYGGCYYERYGRFVHLHLGLSGLTANSVNVVYNLPDGIKPTNRVFSAGTSGDITAAVYAEVTEEGKVSVVPLKTYCGADVYWLL